MPSPFVAEDLVLAHDWWQRRSMPSPFVAEDLVLCRDWRQRRSMPRPFVAEDLCRDWRQRKSAPRSLPVDDTAAFYVLSSRSVIRGRCRAPGQVVGRFCNEVSLEVVSLCKQASPVVLGSRARLSWAILPLGLSENLNKMAMYMNEME